MRTNNNLEQLDQLVHKFFHFAHLKSTFSILHTYFYKTPTSVCLFYTFIQIKYSFLYPHSHRPTLTIHTGITPESTQPTSRKPEKQTQQQDRRTRNQHNLATQSTQSSNPESNKPSNTIHTAHRQKTRKTNPATRSTHPESTQPSNIIHTIQQPGIETNPTTQST